MELLTKPDLLASLASREPDTLFVDPILDPDQIQEVTIDLRLGYDFLVSIVTRQPSIDLGDAAAASHRRIKSYFQETRRDFGDRFVLYPNQVVLGTSLEYLSLPPDMYVDLLSRSSYTRLGVHLNTMIQPGFRGCAPLELFNHGNNAIELVVGSRIVQARFFKLAAAADYLALPRRKYYGDVRPGVSKADRDQDLSRLQRMRDSRTPS